MPKQKQNRKPGIHLHKTQEIKKLIAALDSNEYGPSRRVYYGRPFLHFGWPFDADWLFRLDDDFFFKTGKSFFGLYNVWDWTFAEIATLLELVYIHKILD